MTLAHRKPRIAQIAPAASLPGWTPICRRYAMTQRAAPSSTASSRVGSTAMPASSQPKAPRSSRPILTIRHTRSTSCSPSPPLRRDALRLGADPYAVVPATEATHDHPAGHRPLPSRLLAQASAQSQHQIFVLEPEHHAAPAAADIFVLIGNVLPARDEVRQNPAERQIVGKAGLEDARGEQRAALGHLRRLEFVAQTLL